VKRPQQCAPLPPRRENRQARDHPLPSPSRPQHLWETTAHTIPSSYCTSVSARPRVPATDDVLANAASITLCKVSPASTSAQRRAANRRWCTSCGNPGIGHQARRSTWLWWHPE
jgi:hypothetical protein